MRTPCTTLALFVFTALVCAQECSRDLALINSLLEKANVDQLITDPQAIEADFNALKTSLTSIGLSSLKKDTPRLLFLNGKEKKGRLKKNERRTFVTTLITGDQLKISFLNPLELYGAELVICSHSLKGETTNLAHFTIDENQVADAFYFEFTGLSGAVVSITVRNTTSGERFDFAVAANTVSEFSQENQLSEN